ncbi:macrophage colony-stimulating factor 1 receptor 2 isoform X3 [Haplochromis burtoni]|uniref:macrophage colony-stimulating factor 1 receptor 2 isoform X3 n=1 Tax=Haplochromis burtoni TaxID=8153 RepID=UPI001C2D3B97|nr:macrophage colony-stimulating factor 1 receptor 2 isoform X3 [Haplochromis burtoni]
MQGGGEGQLSARCFRRKLDSFSQIHSDFSSNNTEREREMWLHCLLLFIALSRSAGEPPDPPSIRLNSDFLPSKSDRVLTAGTNFSLSCHGNGSVHWTSTAFPLVYRGNLPDPVEVIRATPRHTGTYTCRYTNESLAHLNSWIHLYVTDPADLSKVFETRHGNPHLKEGEDFLFKCLLTDPLVTNLTLQSEDGRNLPTAMNVTFDPRRGALIRDLKALFNGRYVCSGWKDGRQFKSRPVNLLVLPVLRHPPSLSVSQDEFVRLVGERFEVTCLCSNPTHFYNVTWTDPRKQKLEATNSRYYGNRRLYINSTLSIPEVTQTDNGQYMCRAINEAGVATATIQLKVLERPYLRIYLQTSEHVQVRGHLPAADEIQVNVSGGSLEPITNVSAYRASSAKVNGSSRVEVYEGRDVALTFLLKAYPPITSQRWTTPTHLINNDSTVYQESYAANSYSLEATLLLHRMRPEDRGQYLFHFSNSFFSGSHTIDLKVYRFPTTDITLENSTLTCSSSGYPLPTILWFTCPGIQPSCAHIATNEVSQASVTSQDGEEVRSHFLLSADDDVTVECVASNLMGESLRVFHHRNPIIFTPPLIGVLSATAVLFLLLLVLFYKCRQKPKYEIRWKIIESTDGNNYTFVDPTQLPYNQKWEFPRDKLRLGPILGSGAFGKVVEATAYGLETDNKITRVAVKMLKPSAHSEEREALMSELKILSHLGYHDNIVNLLGACTRGGPMLMITEYCSHGDLLNFLRGRAQDIVASMVTVDEVQEEAFYKNMAAQHARLRSDSGISCCSEYQEMQPILSPGQTHQGVQTDGLSVSDLISFSYQVSQGLDFLSTRNCIHRDVAARNVLLTDRRVAKICDFGLARDIRNDDSYIVQGNARLPVKWMAPESIFQCVYTVQSDVWSYGVLLWEIFSLGKSPYPNIAVDTNFYKMIKDGGHMEQPDFAPAEMYQLMKLCWSLEPTHRPTFKTIGQLISRLLPSTNDMSSRYSDQPTYRNIDECREEEEEEEETMKREDEKPVTVCPDWLNCV